MPNSLNTRDEWLEVDGLGGFASGTVCGLRTRRYHALLLTAVTPPTGRVVLVNGLDAWAETPGGTFPLSSQWYLPDVIHPDGAWRIEAFDPEPWPHWRFALGEGARIDQELFIVQGSPLVVVCWRLAQPLEGVRLTVRPFLSGRDYHVLHRENPTFRFEAKVQEGKVSWQPYADLPGVVAFSNGKYSHQPFWYRNFLYQEERARGLDFTEDLATPGTFRWDLSRGPAVWIVTVAGQSAGNIPVGLAPEEVYEQLRVAEQVRRQRFPTRLHRSADAYLVRRGEAKTIVAGYPWFTDWGRDTFISLRGLCLALGRLDRAREVLLTWASALSEGMIPNRFPDRGETPEFNSVDASLWFVVAVHDFFRTAAEQQQEVAAGDREKLVATVEAILEGYSRGTRYGIRLGEDGLLQAGVPGVQLTWMDVKLNGRVISARIGKPVEVEALWLNALWTRREVPRWADLFARGAEAFRARFWYEAGGHLYDVIDCGHQAGVVDAAFRPNQILAVGGLPVAFLEGERARRVVEAVEARLWTPLGLRSLAPGEPGYVPHYRGGVRQRDEAYHEG
ncbi:MAG: glycogen debranching enzyme N-terminal domain-containing protein, partial [Planctomycetes bacterium]|nr:glycogen debranching enzyme N-terminal domain-containing protein [Planctomycetota bacterium]